MSNYGEMILSKIIDNKDVQALTRFHIEKQDFLTPNEQKAYEFIINYAHENHNETPSLNVLVSEVDFNYIPHIEDSYEYLVKELKSTHAKLKMVELLEKKATEKFDELNGFDFIDWLVEESKTIKQATDLQVKIGSDVKKDTEKYLAEYQRRKEGKSFKIWSSHFPTINNSIGGYTSGNMFAIYGRSGRGKSVLALEEAIEAAQQGATVLYYALEMPDYEIKTRIFSSISARLGVTRLNVGLEEIEAGFEQRRLLQGSLDEEFEEAFEKFLHNIHHYIKGNIIVRAIDDETLSSVNVKTIERDILQLKPDFIVLDPIYLMDFEQNTSRVAGGDVAETSKRLRRLCGRHNVALLIITQAEEDKSQKNNEESGNRELKIPTRSEMKKSKAILEDSAVVIALDSGDGRAIVEVQKVRAGSEGSCDVLFLPSYGVIRELDPSESSASHFEEIF